MIKKKKFIKGRKRLITSALPYINNVPHLGHIVGSHLPADIFARFCRLKGFDVVFIGGTDENGSTSEIAALEVGADIEVFSNRLFDEHKKVYDWFNISYDNFSRTSRKVHHETVKEFFLKLNENGYIKEGTMNVFFSPEDNRYLPDRYVVGECPKCGYMEANGDQCEKCTGILDAAELIDPKSKISNGKLEVHEVEHLFIDLKKLSKPLEKWINEQNLWRKQVKNLALGWIKGGLKKRCITRDLDHGVKVPLEGYENKVFYVWFDAPIGYVSSTRELTDKWEEYWKDTEIFNFLGKDNIPFHAIFWPAMIIGNGEYNLPHNVAGVQYLNYEGKKFSKSKGIGVFCEKLPGLCLSSDYWRFYLSRIIPETNDTEFKWTEFAERVNSDLIGNFGNFVNRIVKFAKTKLDGKLEKPEDKNLTDRDKEVLKLIPEYHKRISDFFESVELRKAYSEILELCSEGNKYLHDTEPWVAIKENPQRANDILYNATYLLKVLSVLFNPIIPQSSERVWRQLGLNGSVNDSGNWENCLEDLGKKHKVGEPEILFKKLEEADIEKLKEDASKGTDLKGFFADSVFHE